MAIELTMPKFGLTMHEGAIQRYFKAAGEAVSAGEPLYEVETEKVLYTVEAPSSGTLAMWAHPEGATVECGGLVAVIAESGDDAAAIGSRYGAVGATNGSNTLPKPAVSGGENTAAQVPRSVAENRRPISPVARKLAAELGVDLAGVEGSGPGGRITREDVERAAKAASRPSASSGDASSAATRPPAPTTDTGAPAAQSVPLRGMRKTIAARMHQSLRDTAQLTISTEADVTPPPNCAPASLANSISPILI